MSQETDMNIVSVTKKSRVFVRIFLYLSVFLLMDLMVWAYMQHAEGAVKQKHLKESAEDALGNYEATLFSYRNFSKSIFDSIINTPEVLSLYAGIVNADKIKQDEIRRELYDELKWLYQVILFKNYRIFHFHQPDGSSFLRFHKPEKYGDNLLGFRYSVQLANKKEVYVEGFEEGRIENSYRFLRPLNYQGKHIGSVEISIAMNEIKEEAARAMDAFPVFLLNQDIVDKEGFTKSDSTYQSFGFEGFSLYNRMRTFARATNNWEQSLIDSINTAIAAEVNPKLRNAESFSVSLNMYGKDFLIRFLPISNVKGEADAAYFVFYSLDDKLQTIHEATRAGFLRISAFLLMFCFFMSLLNEARLRAIQQRKILKIARDRAEVAAKAKAEFLANMSHEIRTPLNGVIGMTEIVANSNLNAEQMEYVSIINRSANNLLAIVNDILDFSKAEANKIELESIAFNPRMLVEGVTELLALKAGEKKLHLISWIDPEVPAELIGDPQRIRQILINLLSNAVKFTAKGEVLLSCSLLELSEKQAKVCFSVKDTGIGISKEAQKNLFQPFSQVDSSTTRKYGGTGLGLVIISRLVDLMGGTIIIESELGKGSEFKVEIPLGFSEKESEKQFIGKVLEGKHFLVIDDNNTNRIILKKYLEIAGSEVELAKDGEDALNILRAENKSFDLLIIDYNMPKMNGMDLARLIQSDHKLRHNKMLLLSSMTDLLERSDIQEVGFNDYFYKPVKQRQLIRIVSRILDIDLQHDDADDEGTEKKSSGDNSPDRKLNVMLVEDNLINQKVAWHSLHGMGHTVEIASNGVEAFDIYKSRHLDVILMDIQMPIMNGLEATRKIREWESVHSVPENERIPIIAMTANAMNEDKDQCLDAGMNAFIPKPFRQEDLREALRQVMSL